MRMLVVASFAILVSACGGGGSSSINVVPKADNLAQICAKENPYLAFATARTQQGSLADEKNWIKAYMSERYLWYRDMPVINEQDSRYNLMSNGIVDVWNSLLNYFSDSVVSAVLSFFANLILSTAVYETPAIVDNGIVNAQSSFEKSLLL